MKSPHVPLLAPTAFSSLYPVYTKTPSVDNTLKNPLFLDSGYFFFFFFLFLTNKKRQTLLPYLSPTNTLALNLRRVHTSPDNKQNRMSPFFIFFNYQKIVVAKRATALIDSLSLSLEQKQKKVNCFLFFFLIIIIGLEGNDLK